MKKLKLILIVLLVVLFLNSCSKDNRTPYQIKMDSIASSLNNVVEVNVLATITDSNVCVYSIDKTIYINEVEDGLVSGYTQTIVSSLGDDFQMVERTDNENFSGNKPDSLFGFKLEESKLSNLEITDTELKATILASQCNEILNSLNINVSTDASLSIIFQEDVLQSWSVSFANSTNKIISINATYNY